MDVLALLYFRRTAVVVSFDFGAEGERKVIIVIFLKISRQRKLSPHQNLNRRAIIPNLAVGFQRTKKDLRIKKNIY